MIFNWDVLNILYISGPFAIKDDILGSQYWEFALCLNMYIRIYSNIWHPNIPTWRLANTNSTHAGIFTAQLRLNSIEDMHWHALPIGWPRHLIPCQLKQARIFISWPPGNLSWKPPLRILCLVIYSHVQNGYHITCELIYCINVLCKRYLKWMPSIDKKSNFINITWNIPCLFQILHYRGSVKYRMHAEH